MRAQDLTRAQAGRQQIKQAPVFRGCVARIRKQQAAVGCKIGERFATQGERHHGLGKRLSCQALAQGIHEVRDDPGGLCQRHDDGRGRARAPAAFVVQVDADRACGLASGCQPDTQGLHQPPDNGQDDFGLLDAILKIEVTDELIGRDIRRVAQGLPFISLRERFEQGDAAASAQTCARQPPQLP